MSEPLLLEFGNTRWKLARAAAQGTVEFIAVGSEIEPLLAYIQSAHASYLAVASVAREEHLNHLRDACSGRIDVHEATVEVGYDITLCYEDPSRLGVDRWLTLLGMRPAKESVAIIDAGTAITLDVMNADGAHLGGWIAPGFRLMQEALIQKSSRLRISEQQPVGLLGTGTEAAIHLGCQASLQGFAAEAVMAAKESLQEYPDRIILTGGDAKLINKKALPHGPNGVVEKRPHLVLEGLAQWVTFQGLS
ncbi:type III pantothenate kinase [Aliidiomarina indica]|uniref:type III pantothenate kinase n=1 Tax=Aliidiomarina indica TaxID=2749147 RepID=UPI0018905A97